MNNRILIYGNYDFYFRFLCRRFKEYGVDAEMLDRSRGNVISKLSKRKYCSVIVVNGMNANKTAKSISGIKKRFSKLPVIAVSYTSLYSVCRRFIESGAEKCIVMPDTVENVCKIVINTLNSSEVYIQEIADFMESYGFPDNINGFYYLCVAVEICIKSPKRLLNNIFDIYESIGERFGVGAKIVERSIRHFSDVSFKRGLFEHFFEDGQNFRPSNRELICAMSDIFTNRFNLYRK